MNPGTKVIVFGKYPGVVRKGPIVPSFVYVEFKMNNSLYRAHVASTDVEVQK